MAISGFSQRALVSGTVRGTGNQPLAAASVILEGLDGGTQTNDLGLFKLTVPGDRSITLVVKYVGYRDLKIPLRLKANENKVISLDLFPDTTALQTISITGHNPNNTRDQVSITRLNPRISKEIPTAFGEFNKILTTLPGVVSNNELSSTYSVRGGNYDENLVYVNGIEIYRPFLVSNAQQEGLSFINPDLVGNIEFSAGGWQPKYGDKLSSVLSIDYKTPEKFAASITGGLMGGGVHVEGLAINNRFTYLIGTRYKNAQLLFNRALEVSGNYRPKFGDFQTLLTYDLSSGQKRGKTIVGFLGSAAQNKYLVMPTTRETTFGSLNQFLRVIVRYEGYERMEYESFQGGLSLKHKFTDNYQAEVIASSFNSREREFRNIEATYNFADVDIDPGSQDFNDALAMREVGTNFDYSRNNLKARVFALETRHFWNVTDQDKFLWGAKWNHEQIKDFIDEYNFTDSADYISIDYVLKADLNVHSNRLSGFVQHSHAINANKTLTYGFRLNYWDYNRETTFSPRIQYAFTPLTNENLSFKAAIGYYYQAPFYRELRNQVGELNPQIKAQRSLHFIAGNEYRFKAWNRNFKFSSEAYFKDLAKVIPYEVDNLRLRYTGLNNAKAYAIGIDTRINGEFIKGAESWFSLGVLSTKENITGDSIPVYSPGSNQLVRREAAGYIRRPSDQRLNFGVFFQDHMPNDPSLKMYLNMVFGTGLPFSPRGVEGFRNRFTMPNYKRVDIGFSKLITLNDGTKNGLESLWLSLEILNLIDANNVVSYNYIKDINRVTYAVPNYLSSRLLNLRMVARF